MDVGFASVRSISEFRYYFPNSTSPSPLDYVRPIPMDVNRLILIVSFSILLTVGILANAWVARIVITVFRQTRTEASKAVQIYILALCACDVFVLAFLSLLLLDLWYGQWMLPFKFLCKLYLMSESLSKFYAPFLLVELSGFCYFGVKCRKVSIGSTCISTSTHTRTTKLAIGAVLLALLLSFAFMIPVYVYADVYYLIFYNSSDDVYAAMTKCAFQPPDSIMAIFTLYSFTCGYLIPACLFSVFYVALLAYVHKRRRKSSCTTVKSLDYFSRIARTSLGLVLFYFLSWTPYWIMSVYQYFDTPQDYREISDAGIIMSYFIHMLPYINCNAYPLLYTIMNRSIQHDYLRACERSRSLSQRRSKLTAHAVSSPSSLFRFSYRSSHGNSIRSDPNSTAIGPASPQGESWGTKKPIGVSNTGNLSPATFQRVRSHMGVFRFSEERLNMKGPNNVIDVPLVPISTGIGCAEKDKLLEDAC